MSVGSVLFFFNDTATTEIYTLSLHDALPISTTGSLDPPEAMRPWIERSFGSVEAVREQQIVKVTNRVTLQGSLFNGLRDRKSTRLNSSHANISYAVFCLKKKNKTSITYPSDA